MLVKAIHHRFFTRFLVLTLCFGLSFPFAPSAFAAPSAEQYNAQLAVYEQIRSNIPDYEFSTTELSFELAFEEPDTLFEYVVDRIAFESYRGALRGGEGALVSRAGNAFDQALILATLLDGAGYEAQVVTATLSDQDAARLLTRLGEQPDIAPKEVDVDEALAEALLATSDFTLEELLSIDLNLTNTDVYSSAVRAQQAFTGYLTGAPDIRAELLAEAKMYAFVQYRFSPSDEWEALHPAFGFLAPPTVEVEDSFSGEIPLEYLHTLTIEVLMERKVQEELELVPVTRQWTRPIANMLNVPIEVSIVPMRDVEADAFSAGKYNESEFFIAQVNRNPDSTAVAFEMMGRTLDPDVAADPAADYFQTLGSAMNQATGLLGALGTSKPPVEPLALTGMVIRYTVSVPGAEAVTYERYVYDRITPENRVNGEQLIPIEVDELDRGLVQQHVLMINPGGFTEAYAQLVFTELGIKTYEALTKAERLSNEYEAAGMNMPLGELAELAADVGLRAHWPLLAGLDALPITDDVISYRPEAAIVSVGTVTGATADDSPAFVVDIIHNNRRVLEKQGDQFAMDRATMLLYGAWETALEKRYAEQQFLQPAHNAINMFENGTPTFTALTGSDADLSAVSLSARRAVQVDLNNGFTVLYPSITQDVAHWWRLNPTTGELLGIGENGAGQAMVEYLNQLAGIVSPILNVLGALNGVGTCIDVAFQGGDADSCMKTLLITTGIGIGAGLALSMATGGGNIAGLLLYDVPTSLPMLGP